MFRKYGLIGILMIFFVEINFLLKIQPFANWYFPIVWCGYILTIDALVYKLRKNSLISNRFNSFLGMILLSILIWFIFEFVNISFLNWNYSGVSSFGALKYLFGALSFSTVLPAFFETFELIRSIHLFDKFRLHKQHKISKNLIHVLIIIGIACFVLPIVLPKYTFYLIWFAFFFILDPINYLHEQPSIIRHLKDRELKIPLALLAAGVMMGFLWEFWNYWAISRWTYDLPSIAGPKVFEMPIFGYIGYFPFAFELYAMYFFIRSLFLHKEYLLVK